MTSSPLSPSPSGTAWRALDWAVAAFVAVLAGAVTWGYGGQIAWVRQFIAGWGVVGLVLLWPVLRCRRGGVPGSALWPLGVFNLLVAVSCLNPSFTDVIRGGVVWMESQPAWPWLPSAARPALAWRELWQLDVVVLAAFLAGRVLRTRGQVRLALYALGGNAVVLAVLGTVQKLQQADGLWFGRVPAVNPLFFSTFVYHNHWGAYALLATGGWLGLGFEAWRRGGPRGPWLTAAPACAMAVLLLAATAPLSASRSCTVLAAVLLGVALGHAIRRAGGRSQGAALLAAVAALAAAGWIAHLGEKTITARWRLTAAQLDEMSRSETLNSRLQLYRDTWAMAAARPWTGWGLESYAHVFRLFNTQRAKEKLPGRPFYAEAHSDWLQALAEVGAIGTGLLVMLVVVPLRALRLGWRGWSPGAVYPLAACLMIAAYAWVEFPFANPAVMLAFWLNYFLALRYADLGRASRSA